MPEPDEVLDEVFDELVLDEVEVVVIDEMPALVIVLVLVIGI
jgi:hypothetical protein